MPANRRLLSRVCGRVRWETGVWAFAALLCVLRLIGHFVGAWSEGSCSRPWSQTQRHIACGTGHTNTKEITTDGEVVRVSSCEAATHNDTVACNPSALTQRNCNIFWAEDKRWKHLIDATFDNEPEGANRADKKMPFGTSAEKLVKKSSTSADEVAGMRNIWFDSRTTFAKREDAVAISGESWPSSG